MHILSVPILPHHTGNLSSVLGTVTSHISDTSTLVPYQSTPSELNDGTASQRDRINEYLLDLAIEKYEESCWKEKLTGIEDQLGPNHFDLIVRYPSPPRDPDMPPSLSQKASSAYEEEETAQPPPFDDLP